MMWLGKGQRFLVRCPGSHHLTPGAVQITESAQRPGQESGSEPLKQVTSGDEITRCRLQHAQACPGAAPGGERMPDKEGVLASLAEAQRNLGIRQRLRGHTYLQLAQCLASPHPCQLKEAFAALGIAQG